EIDRLVDAPAAPGEGDAERCELALEMPGPHAEDDPPARERIERGEGLRGDERVPVGQHVDVREEADVAGRGSEEPERRHGVVPRGRHGGGARAGNADVITDAEVEEPAPVARLGDPAERGGPGP